MLLKKLKNVFGIISLFATMAMVQGCGSNENAVNSVANNFSDNDTLSESRVGNSPVAASVGAYMYVSWPFYNWTSSSGWTIYGSSVWTHIGADKYALDLSKDNCNGYGVYAGIAGKVIQVASPASWNGGYGGTVVIYDQSRHVAIRYSHLSYVNVIKGQWVSYRQYIGKLGNTGKSTGPHLHIAAYENINDNYGNPIVPNTTDSEHFACQIRWIF